MTHPAEVHYVIVGRRSAHKRDEIAILLKDSPQFQVIVDRRRSERRRNSFPVMGSENRTGIERRLSA